MPRAKPVTGPKPAPTKTGSKGLGWAAPNRRRARQRESFERDLREFLDGDPGDCDADPAFKERLRQELLARLEARSSND